MRQPLSKKSTIAIIVTVIAVAILATLFFIDPTMMVEQLGIRNGYILLALVAFFSGFSPIGYASFISILLALSLGGLNPLALALVAGVGLCVGDTIIFFLATHGRTLLKGKWERMVNGLAGKFTRTTLLKHLTPFVTYIYIALTPLPNDFLLLFLAAIRYPAKYTVPILIAGDLTFSFFLVFFTQSVTSLLPV